MIYFVFLYSIQLIQSLNNVKQFENENSEYLVKEIQPRSFPVKKEETVDSLLETDETCITIQNKLSNLHEETMSIVNLQLAIDALESGDLQYGIETLQASVQTGTNAAALYNLGICYERGIGVRADRAKVLLFYLKI